MIIKKEIDNKFQDKERKCTCRFYSSTVLIIPLVLCKAMTTHGWWDRAPRCDVLPHVSPSTACRHLFSWWRWCSWSAVLPAGRPDCPAAGREDSGRAEARRSLLTCTSFMRDRCRYKWPTGKSIMQSQPVIQPLMPLFYCMIRGEMRFLCMVARKKIAPK